MFIVDISTQKITNGKTFSFEDKNKKLTFDFVLFNGEDAYFAEGDKYRLQIGGDLYSVFAIDDNKLSFRNVILTGINAASQTKTFSIVNTETDAEILSDSVQIKYTGQTGGGGDIDLSEYVTSSVLSSYLQPVNSAVSANAGAIESARGDIIGVTSDVTANAVSIGLIESDVSALTITVSGNTENISANAGAIQAVNSTVSANVGAISGIRGDITALTSNVNSYAVSIGLIESNVSAMSAGVNANTSAIQSITGNIASNTSAINQVVITIGNIGSALDAINGEIL